VILALGSTVAGLTVLGLQHALQGTRLGAVLTLDRGRLPSVRDPAFLRTVAAVAEVPMSGGHDVRLLAGGDQTYAALVSDLRAARRSITVAMYYGKPGAVSEAVLGALAERARRGVPVYFMYDAVGTDRLPEPSRQALVDAGVHLTAFRPFRWRDLGLFHRRAHTRVIVVDGAVGYTGGFGFDDKWVGSGRRAAWRETNVRFTGPAVAQLQGAFVEEWAEATGELLAGEPLFPTVPPAGDYTAGLLHSLPGAAPSPAERALALSIAAARRTLYISNAYFLPDASYRALLIAAARRGVDVRVLTAGRGTDNSLAKLAGQAHYEELLAAGIRIYEYRPAMMHAKTLVTDGAWCSIGSMNFDNRSLALNSETTLLVLDPRTGAAMDALFRADLAQSDEVVLEQLRHRSWALRLLQVSAGLLARAL
jgi:cardiolipin synthase